MNSPKVTLGAWHHTPRLAHSPGEADDGRLDALLGGRDPHRVGAPAPPARPARQRLVEEGERAQLAVPHVVAHDAVRLRPAAWRAMCRAHGHSKRNTCGDGEHTGTVNVTQVGTENRGHSKRNTYGDGEQTGMVNETPVGTGNTSETAKIAQQQRVLKYYFILHCYISLNCCSHQRLYMPACITLLGGHFSSKAEALKIAILCSEAS